ncbi:hypothetical protein [Paenibacillus macerans]|uniref:hypothetical protein n=1 Tax=Paenibacillus macerans TaxID=44252 RepID=UPI00203A95A2|nr:hypothetical protein [Paenibacillus macerans]MCM3699770.1 hypothetical protein [Paenibacillus macerans]
MKPLEQPKMLSIESSDVADSIMSKAAAWMRELNPRIKEQTISYKLNSFEQNICN